MFVKKTKKIIVMWGLALILVLISLEGCTKPSGSLKIGIATVSAHIPVKTQIKDGFKAGMTEMGYIEGKNIEYIDSQIPEIDTRIIDLRIRELIAGDIDLLLTFDSEVALRAKEIVKGTEMPVVFCTSIKPVEKGLIENPNHPGGNLTGVQFVGTNSKALEWLIKALPGVKKVCLPYNPDDVSSGVEIEGFDKDASYLGIELVFCKIHSVEEAVAAVEKLDEDVDAIFMVPSPTLNERNIELNRAAHKKGIPMGASIRLDGDVLITLATDFYSSGRQTARLASLILQGVKPADLPVESSEAFLTINLRAADELGIHISDDILAQATTIIR